MLYPAFIVRGHLARLEFEVNGAEIPRLDLVHLRNDLLHVGKAYASPLRVIVCYVMPEQVDVFTELLTESVEPDTLSGSEFCFHGGGGWCWGG